MRQILLSNKIRVLTIALLVIVAFFRGELASYLILGVFAVFIITAVFPYIKKGFYTMYSTDKIDQQIVKCKNSMKLSARHAAQTQEIKEMEAEIGAVANVINHELLLSEKERNTLMLRHIRLRITEKLQSAYPEGTWDWEGEVPDLDDILTGKTSRIACLHTGDYTHADITIDKFARIKFEMLIVGAFESDDQVDEKSNSSIVDVEAWYDLSGRMVLERLITDLNARGHAKLFIKASGEVVTKQAKKEFVEETLMNFPEKKYWKKLCELFEKEDLTATVTNYGMTVSWL